MDTPKCLTSATVALSFGRKKNVNIFQGSKCQCEARLVLRYPCFIAGRIILLINVPKINARRNSLDVKGTL